MAGGSVCGLNETGNNFKLNLNSADASGRLFARVINIRDFERFSVQRRKPSDGRGHVELPWQKKKKWPSRHRSSFTIHIYVKRHYYRRVPEADTTHGPRIIFWPRRTCVDTVRLLAAALARARLANRFSPENASLTAYPCVQFTGVRPHAGPFAFSCFRKIRVLKNRFFTTDAKTTVKSNVTFSINLTLLRDGIRPIVCVLLLCTVKYL